MAKLIIKNLFVESENKKIINDFSYEFDSSKIYSILGPNGHGKSTLFQTILGNPRYRIISGDILLNDESILEWDVDKRANAGLFLAMQHPTEVPGVNNFNFLRSITSKKDISIGSFVRNLEEISDELGITMEHKHRYLNDGFSGGEKKKNELLQLELLNPEFALLDEIDSGLDVDAIQLAAKSIMRRCSEGKGAIIISHADKIYQNLKVDHTLVIYNGSIVKEGDGELQTFIHKYGFDWIKSQLGVEEKEINPLNCSLGVVEPNCSECK